MKLSVRDLSLGYGGRRVVERLTFEASSGEFVSLLGPSGCGKTTVLNALAGFIAPQEGEIAFDGRPVAHLKPQERNIGMVFQNYALYPHMTAYDNIAFPLRARGEGRAARDSKIRDVAALTRIEDILDKKPAEMSGGQQQRVAISRALVKQPALLLMDEPLSNLDAGLRIEMREEILRIQSRIGITTIFVTHDQEEALSLSSRVILLCDGRVQQIGSPEALYRSPENFFTASFFGNPPVNVLDGVGMGGELALFDGALRVACPVGAGLAVKAVVRCEGLSLASRADAHFQARVVGRELLGRDWLVRVVAWRQPLRLLTSGVALPEVGTWAPLRFNENALHVFDAESGRRVDARPAPSVEKAAR